MWLPLADDCRAILELTEPRQIAPATLLETNCRIQGSEFILMTRGKESLQESSDDEVFERISPLPRKIESAGMRKDSLRRSPKVRFFVTTRWFSVEKRVRIFGIFRNYLEFFGIFWIFLESRGFLAFFAANVPKTHVIPKNSKKFQKSLGFFAPSILCWLSWGWGPLKTLEFWNSQDFFGIFWNFFGIFGIT